MIKKLKFYLYLVTYILFVLNASNAQPNPNNTSKSTLPSEITIASEPDYPPFCFIDKEGNPDGFSVTLFKEAAKAVGLNIKIKIGVWDKIKQDLISGEIDALPLVGRTPERERYFDFTLPYISLHGAVFVRNGTNDIHSLEDLKHKSIVVMKGDNAEEFVRRENISDQIYTTNTFEVAFKELASGEYDAVITQRVMGLKLIETLGLNSISALNLQLPKFQQDFCFAVKKGNKALLSKLNEGLSVIIANNSYNEIHEKWFGPTVKEKISFNDILVIVVYTLIPVILVLSVTFILFLRREVRKRTIRLSEEIAEHKATLESLHNKSILLMESEDRWKKAIASSPVPIMIHDEDGVVLQLSEGWTRYSGYALEDIPTIGDWTELAYGKRTGEEEKYIQKLFEINQTVSNGEWNVTAKDGSVRIWDFQTTPLGAMNKGKRVVHSMAIDITERRKSEDELTKYRNHLEELVRVRTEELEHSNQKLERSLEKEKELNELKTRFISTASHEFRTPLTVIHSSIELLERSLKDHGNHGLGKHISKIINSVDTVTALIDEVLMVSRADAGKLTLEKSSADLYEFYTEFIQETRLHLDKKYSVELDYVTEQRVFFIDVKHMNTMMQNLISNSAKYSPDGGIIKIIVKSGDGFLKIEIKDTGIGIPRSEIPFIFDRFHRASNSGTIQGSGLGLSIVKSLIELQGGEISVESELGRGTTIAITLPV